jgi:hypothetical protein
MRFCTHIAAGLRPLAVRNYAGGRPDRLPFGKLPRVPVAGPVRPAGRDVTRRMCFRCAPIFHRLWTIGHDRCAGDQRAGRQQPGQTTHRLPLRRRPRAHHERQQQPITRARTGRIAPRQSVASPRASQRDLPTVARSSGQRHGSRSWRRRPCNRRSASEHRGPAQTRAAPPVTRGPGAHPHPRWRAQRPLEGTRVELLSDWRRRGRAQRARIETGPTAR